jgi:hypothetical protein
MQNPDITKARHDDTTPRRHEGWILVFVFVVFVFAVRQAPAHHAFAAEFDAKKPVKLQGTVSMVEWINPHAWIHIDVKRPDGVVETWMIEGGTPNTLFRRGVTKNSLPIGTALVVDGYQAKDGTLKANGRDITFPDGRKLFIGSTGTGAPGDPQPPQK